jgi:hypothetical protein
MYIVLEFDPEGGVIQAVTTNRVIAETCKRQERELDNRWIETWQLDESMGERTDRPGLVVPQQKAT